MKRRKMKMNLERRAVKKFYGEIFHNFKSKKFYNMKSVATAATAALSIAFLGMKLYKTF
jgi:hypothetical protein